MKNITKNKLLSLVKKNYDDIAADFSATRYAVWPELRTVIARLTEDGESRRASEVERSETKRGNPARFAQASARRVSVATSVSSRDCHVVPPTAELLAMTILDLGCGNGHLLEIFKDKKVRYTGVEQSEKLAHYAREYIQKNNIKNADIITGNILNLDKLVNKQFDLILLIAVLPHIPSHELRAQFLKNIKTKLKPSGRLIISAWDLNAKPGFKTKIFKYTFLKLIKINKMELNDIIFPWKNNQGQAVSPRYYHVFSVVSLKKLTTEAGFNIEKIYSDKHNIYAICK